jgi:hypothetical protein
MGDDKSDYKDVPRPIALNHPQISTQHTSNTKALTNTVTMSSTPTRDTQKQAVRSLAPLASEASNSTAQPSSAQQAPTLLPYQQPPATTTQPNGYGLIKDNHIIGIFMDSDLGREYKKLTTKAEKREFLLSKGENRGKVVFNTRRQAPDVVYGAGTSESK